MVDFNIELYGATSQDRGIYSHRHNVKGWYPEDHLAPEYYPFDWPRDILFSLLVLTSVKLIDDDDSSSKNIQFIKTKACGLSEHMVCKNTSLVNVIYLNKSTGLIETRNWSVQIIKTKTMSKSMFGQDKDEWFIETKPCEWCFKSTNI